MDGGTSFAALTHILERFHRAESQIFEPKFVVKINLDKSLIKTDLRPLDFSQKQEGGTL